MGFSDVLGDVDLDSHYNRLSTETKQKIDSEVRRIVDESRQRAMKLLTERRKELELIANALVEYEVLNLEEMQKVLKGEKLPKMSSKEIAGGKDGGLTEKIEKEEKKEEKKEKSIVPKGKTRLPLTRQKLSGLALPGENVTPTKEGKKEEVKGDEKEEGREKEGGREEGTS